MMEIMNGKILVEEGVFRPYLLRDLKKRRRLLDNIVKMVSKATPVHTAFIANGIPRRTYDVWRNKLEEEREKIGEGETTEFIEFFKEIEDANSNNESVLAGVMYEKAVDEKDINAVKYLLDKRHHWKESTSVEVSAQDDAKFEFNIVPMKDNYSEDDEKDE